MIREQDRYRIGKARLLRRQGKTYDEIREVVGEVSKDRLADWLRGIPRPAATNRSHPLPALAQECRRLRSLGLTQGEIVQKTGASVGSVSLWLRGVKVPASVEARRQQHLQDLRGRGARSVHDAAVRRRDERTGWARSSVDGVTQRDLFMLGLALYWAEGSKDKPWRRTGRVTFTNSDPTVLRVFLAWLDLAGIRNDHRRYRLSIHESADVSAHERWWREELGLRCPFDKPTIKRHNPKPGRHNRGDWYHGCLVVTVSRSMALYDAIDGWWHRVSELVPKNSSSSVSL